jgi:hypothetical protein
VWLLTESLFHSVASGLLLATIASMTGTIAYVIALWLGWPDDLRRQLDFARLVMRSAG